MLDLFWTSSGHVRFKPMAPFEREPMTSYSTLMVTFSLYARVSKLQPSEICLTSVGPHFDLFRSCEVQANGDSKPPPMTFYSTSIVTLALSASVSELQPLEQCLILIGRRFDHFRSSEGQANGGNRPATHDFLFNFKSNHSLSITVLKL